MLFFIVVPFINVLVILLMLAYELKRAGCHLSTLADKKIMILSILALMQLRKFAPESSDPCCRC